MPDGDKPRNETTTPDDRLTNPSGTTADGSTNPDEKNPDDGSTRRNKTTGDGNQRLPKTDPTDPDYDALRRAEAVIKVRCGMISAKDVCRELGISRKTYYKWEDRILGAMLESARDKKPGRPGHPESELRKVESERKIAELTKENEFLQKKIELKNLALELSPAERGNPRPKSKKKKR